VLAGCARAEPGQVVMAHWIRSKAVARISRPMTAVSTRCAKP
jgi:hypothetical protein